MHTEVENIITHLLKLKAKYFDLKMFLLNRVNMLQLLRFSFRMSKNLLQPHTKLTFTSFETSGQRNFH